MDLLSIQIYLCIYIYIFHYKKISVSKYHNFLIKNHFHLTYS